MELQSIALSNFGMYESPVSVEFPRTGLVLLTANNHDCPEMGANACGKSTLAEAIVWTLYGRTARGVRGRGIATWGSRQAPSVQIQCELHGENVTIERLFSPERVSISGADVSGGASDWLGLTADEFASAISIPQDFRSFVDMTPAQRLALLGPSFQLERWDEAIKSAGAVAKRRSRFYDRAARHVSFVRGKLESLEQQLEDVGEAPATDKIKKRIEKAKQEIQEFDEHIKKHADNAKQHESESEEFDRKKNEEADKISNLRVEKDKLEWHIKSAEAERKDSNKKIKRIKTGSGECPVCRREWSKADRGTLAHMLRQERDFHKSDVNRLHEKLKKIAEDIARREEERDKHQHGATRAKQAARAEYERSREAERGRRAAQDAFGEANAALASAEAHAARVEALSGRVEEARDALVRAGGIRSFYEADSASSEEWKKRFGRLKLWLADQQLETLSEMATGVLGDLGMAEWRLDFAAARKSASGTGDIHGLHAQVSKPHADERVSVPVESWSGGEKQRLRVACAASVGEYVREAKSVDIGFEIWDEPTAHLSREGVEKLLDFLSVRARERLVIVIDHRAPDISPFDGVLVAHRENERVSRLTWE